MGSPDRIEFRADSKGNEGLAKRFEDLLKAHAGDKADLMRAALIALCENIERHDRIPRLPLVIESKQKKK